MQAARRAERSRIFIFLIDSETCVYESIAIQVSERCRLCARMDDWALVLQRACLARFNKKAPGKGAFTLERLGPLTYLGWGAELGVSGQRQRVAWLAQALALLGARGCLQHTLPEAALS